MTDTVGGAVPVEVQTQEAVTTHVITLLQLHRWLDGATPSPNEAVKKNRLRELLAQGH